MSRGGFRYKDILRKQRCGCVCVQLYVYVTTDLYECIGGRRVNRKVVNDCLMRQNTICDLICDPSFYSSCVKSETLRVSDHFILLFTLTSNILFMCLLIFCFPFTIYTRYSTYQFEEYPKVTSFPVENRPQVVPLKVFIFEAISVEEPTVVGFHSKVQNEEGSDYIRLKVISLKD